MISNRELQNMFRLANMSKKKLHSALRVMGKNHLKSQWRDQWTEDRVTTGYCYPVSEVVFHFTNRNTDSYILKNSDNTTHWFLRTKTGRVIDLTADQIDGYFDYDSGVQRRFMTKEISMRGKILAMLIGVIYDG